MSKKSKIFIAIGAIIVAVVVGLIVFNVVKKENITYTVTFDSDGGSIVEEQLIIQGEKADRPVDPVKDGFIFVEWRYSGELFDFNTVIEEDITLKAHWLELEESIEMIVVKFDTIGGTTISNQVIEKGSKILKPNNPVKDGYIFKGWFVDSMEFSFESEVDEDIVLTAKWEKEEVKTANSNSSNSSSNNSTNQNSGTQSGKNENTNVEKRYTVSFNSNGGSAVASQSIKEGAKATRPSNPSRSGYTFEGWTLNGKTYNFESKVTSNITLVANWKENPKVYYTVSFDSNGGSSISSQSILAGSAASNPGSPSREGYIFNGWFLNGNSYNFGSAVNGNITLVASWTQKSYVIKSANVDDQTPDMTLTVYENGVLIPVSSIKYTNGIELCSGNNMTVNRNDIAGISTFIVVLSGGTQVTATLS